MNSWRTDSDACCLSVCFASPQPPTPQLPLKHVDTPVSSSPHPPHLLPHLTAVTCFQRPSLNHNFFFPIHHQHAHAQFSMESRLVVREMQKRKKMMMKNEMVINESPPAVCFLCSGEGGSNMLVVQIRAEFLWLR